MSISLQEESNKFADLLTYPLFIPKLFKRLYYQSKNANKFKTGDIVYTSDTNKIYVKLDSGLTELSNGFNTIEDSYKDKELDNQVLRCKSCGSIIDPSKVDRNNNITCPYCNSVNHIFIKEYR